MAAEIFGNWQLNGNVTLASGTPFTARVLGNVGGRSQRRQRHTPRQQLQQ